MPMTLMYNPHNPLAALIVFCHSMLLSLVFYVLVVLFQSLYLIGLVLGFVVSLWHYRPWGRGKGNFLSYRWGFARSEILSLEADLRSFTSEFERAKADLQQLRKQNDDLAAHIKNRQALETNPAK